MKSKRVILLFSTVNELVHHYSAICRKLQSSELVYFERVLENMYESNHRFYEHFWDQGMTVVLAFKNIENMGAQK